MIPALVLTAGLATRLRPLSLVRAKAAIPLGGEPIAARILRWLAREGVTDAVLNLHHLPASLTGRIGDGQRYGLRVRYSWESPEVLGSAGGPRRATPLMGADTFLVTNGDTLTDLPLSPLLSAHRASGALVTLAVIPNTQQHKYGGVTADASGVFTGVVPRGATAQSFHFIGVQVVDARAFTSLEDGVPAESIRTLYPALTRATPGAVRVHVCEASFIDIGTPRDYIESCRTVCRDSSAGLLERGANVRIAAGARLHDVIAWDDVTVEDGAELDRVILTDGVTVPAGRRFGQAILRRYDGPLGVDEQRDGELAVAPLPAF